MQYFGKSVITTKNSIYIVDWDERLVDGGKFEAPTPFTKGFCQQGCNMVLYLCDGGVLRTSTVLDIKQEVKHEADCKQQKGLARLFCFNRG